jgi:phage tail protein X
MEMRINGAVTTSRLKQAVISVSHTLDQLADWQAAQLAAGYTHLDDVPAVKVNSESVKVHRYRRAVFSIARAHILGTNRDVDTTGDAGEKRAAALATGRRYVARCALGDIRHSRHCCSAGSVLMKVKALQGDTVDLMSAPLRHHAGRD